jgi:hypothetical protein
MPFAGNYGAIAEMPLTHGYPRAGGVASCELINARRAPLATHSPGVDLYWLPLGAGGSFVKFNGRAFEALQAVIARRRPLDLYHSALEVNVAEGRRDTRCQRGG